MIDFFYQFAPAKVRFDLLPDKELLPLITIKCLFDGGHEYLIVYSRALLKEKNIMENNPRIVTLHNLLDYDACGFISAEVQLKNSVTAWINSANSMRLKIALQKYLDFIKQHIQKIEGFLSEEGQMALSLNNRVMHSFIEETNEKLSFCTDQEVKDASLIACIQAINHYKISAYGTAAAFARILELNKAGEVFTEAETNEKEIDKLLSQLAESGINNEAKAPIVLPGTE